MSFRRRLKANIADRRALRLFENIFENLKTNQRALFKLSSEDQLKFRRSATVSERPVAALPIKRTLSKITTRCGWSRTARDTAALQDALRIQKSPGNAPASWSAPAEQRGDGAFGRTETRLDLETVRACESGGEPAAVQTLRDHRSFQTARSVWTAVALAPLLEGTSNLHSTRRLQSKAVSALFPTSHRTLPLRAGLRAVRKSIGNTPACWCY